MTSPVTSSLRWALYLGVSWTWCIGMFLPVLITRDFGAWAFLVFALPNVIGAAAMGWVIPDAAASRRLVSQHAGAMVAFSQVTVAYQCFFAGWMLPQLIGWWTGLFYPLILVLVVIAIRRDREFSLITLVTWLVSLSLGVALASRSFLTLPDIGKSAEFLGGTLLAPVCLLGFLLCPYLDLTFHHGLQKAYEAGGKLASRTAFTLGFVVVFGLMILFTLGYARLILNPTSGGRMLVGFHMLAQLAVTVVLHFIRAGYAAQNPKGIPGGPLLILAGYAVGIALFFLPAPFDWHTGETIYRAFLVAYGLVFPLYVLTKLIPSRPIPTRTLLWLCALGVPFYAIGFYSKHTEVLAAGVVMVVVGSALAVRRAKDRSRSEF